MTNRPAEPRQVRLDLAPKYPMSFGEFRSKALELLGHMNEDASRLGLRVRVLSNVERGKAIKTS